MGAERLKREAEVFGRYILGVPPPEAVVRLYISAMLKLAGSATAVADPTTRFAMKYPWSVGLLDAALAFRDRGAPLRLRLLVMFAILETQPIYSEHFLPFSHNLLDVARVAISGLRAGVSVVFGWALLWFANRR